MFCFKSFGFACGELTVRVCFLFLTLSLSIFNASAQQQKDTIFRQPLNLPVALAGTFAELRSNHFHSGIDFRTQGSIGHKVYACEQGYVSRISVSPGGYGNALYITHPNGYTTVYGHLNNFNEEITAYVKQQQYKREQFSIAIYPDSTRLPVKRGEIVAFSGNTGGSSGPHLHFEVRDTKTENIINPLLFGFGVKDNIAPIIRRLAVYPIGKGSTVNGSTDKLILDLEKVGKSYRIAGNKKLKINGKVAFGIDTHDQSYGSVNRCGPYGIKLWVDSSLMFSQTMDQFSFDESRYINSLIDYEYYMKEHVRFNRLYIEPNNQLSMYDHNVDRGIVSFPDSAEHKGLIVVRDLHGNNSRLNFVFSYVPDKTAQAPSAYLRELVVFPDFLTTAYKKEFVYSQQGIRVVIPADALYDDIDFKYSSSKKTKGLYSDIYCIHDPYTPLHKAMTIEIAADSLPECLYSKALIVQVDNGGRSNAGGIYQNGVVRTESRSFGCYAIGVDTIPPRITPINIKNGANLRGVKNIRFKIRDDFSGINSYIGHIDGVWVLFEYDAKNDLIFYDFDAERIAQNTQHTLELKVTDNKGNTTEYSAKFTW